MKTNEYTGGRQMMVTDIPDFPEAIKRQVTIADVTPGCPEYEAREAYRHAIEEQYLWELEREEYMRFRKGVLRAGRQLAIGLGMVAVVVIAVIGFGYIIGA